MSSTNLLTLGPEKALALTDMVVMRHEQGIT